VKIRILISQDDYHDLNKRAEWLDSNPNLELRIKFYSLKPGDYLAFQMHNKWMIVDHRTILTGSFNWSESSENSFIENVLEINGSHADELLPTYEAKFEELWDRGRKDLPAFEKDLKAKRDKKETPTCGFSPISLTQGEVKTLLALAPRCK